MFIQAFCFLHVIFMKKFVFVSAFFAFLLFWQCDLLEAQKVRRINAVAVMPFENITQADLSIDITQLVTESLIKNEFKVISHDFLESFLIKKRIRRADFLGRSVIREMGATLNIDALIVGSVGLLEAGENPRVAINAQMIDCFDASVVWANSVSCTGSDFATFLGLGKITSLDKIAKIAVDDLLKGLPSTIKSHTSSLLPFEIVQAGFFPEILRGGEMTTLRIEVREVIGSLRNIKAFVLGAQVALKTKDGRKYTGNLKAPSIEGVYPLKLYVTSQWNRLVSLEGMASLTVSNTPPEVKLLCRRTQISPNNDGVNDRVVFFPELLKSSDLEGWEFEITDKDGIIVRSEDRLGRLPDSLVWKGENNKYKRVKDGVYFCRLIAIDKAGNRAVTPKQMVVVDTTPPGVEVFLNHKDEEKIELDIRVTDADISKITDWKLTIYNGEGYEVGRADGMSDMPETLTFPVKKIEIQDQSKNDLTAYSLEVTDVAGNRLQIVRQPLKSPVIETPDLEQPVGKKIWIEDF